MIPIDKEDPLTGLPLDQQPLPTPTSPIVVAMATVEPVTPPPAIMVPVQEPSHTTVSSLTEPPPVPTHPHPPSQRALSTEELALVQQAIHSTGPDSQTIAMIDTIPVTRASIQTLRPDTYLNDEVINAYLQLIRRRLRQQTILQNSSTTQVLYSTFFMTKLLDLRNDTASARGVYDYDRVRRWGRRAPDGDIFQLQHLYIPINENESHWIGIHIDFANHEIRHLDSMHGNGQYYSSITLRYLPDEHLRLHNCALPASWSIRTRLPHLPQQDNGYDCGVFLCQFFDYLTRTAPMDFTAEHKTHMRARIALSLLQGAIPLV